MPFNFKKLDIPEVILIEPKVFSDNRGFFLENYKKTDFKLNGITDEFIQDNFSFSKKGVIRGLHYQDVPKSQSKLISVKEGEILDVAVDIRKNSPTYGKWVGEYLSDENHNMLYVPEGFAHGFCVVSEGAKVHYKVNREFAPEYDRGIIWNDPTINIMWPIENPIISDKDKQLPSIDDCQNNF